MSQKSAVVQPITRYVGGEEGRRMRMTKYRKQEGKKPTCILHLSSQKKKKNKKEGENALETSPPSSVASQLSSNPYDVVRSRFEPPWPEMHPSRSGQRRGDSEREKQSESEREPRCPDLGSRTSWSARLTASCYVTRRTAWTGRTIIRWESRDSSRPVLM